MLLVHNPDSGEGDHSGDSLTALLEGAGGEVSHLSTSTTGWRTRIHDSDADVVVVAGGDGTVHAVMIAMASSRKPIAIIPLGTANNIARGVGIPVGDVSASIEFWREDPSGSARGFDVPLAVIGTRENRWVESVGVGLVAGVLLEADHTEQDPTEQDPTEQGLSHGRTLLGRALDEPPKEFHWEIRLDDKDLSGKFAVIEAMNIPAIGPRVKLAPSADPGDGLIDFVALTASQCMEMTNAEDTPEHRSVQVGQRLGPEVHRGRHLTLRCDDLGLPVHIDDRSWTSDGSATEIEVVNDGVQVVVLSPR